MKLNIVQTGPLEYQYPDIEDVVKAIFPDHSIPEDDWSPEVDGIRLEWQYTGDYLYRHPIALRLSFRSDADYRRKWRAVDIKNGAIDEAAVRIKHTELVTLKVEHDARGAEARAKRVEADEQLRGLRDKIGPYVALLPRGNDVYELRVMATEAQALMIAEAVKDILQ